MGRISAINYLAGVPIRHAVSSYEQRPLNIYPRPLPFWFFFCTTGRT